MRVDSTGFCESRGPGTHLAVAASHLEDVEALLHSSGGVVGRGALAALLAAGVAHPGGRAGVWHVRLARSARELHVRAFAHGGWLRSLTGDRLLRLDRPRAELEVTALLRSRGVPVPVPVFVLAERRGLFWHAALATELLPDASSGGDFLRAAPVRARLLDVVRAAGHTIRKLHDAGGCHADLHVDNLLVVGDEREPARVVVTDLDRAKIMQRVAPRRRMGELMRLLRSLVKQGFDAHADDELHAAFLEAYTDGDRRLHADLLRYEGGERRRLARHATLYRGKAS